MVIVPAAITNSCSLHVIKWVVGYESRQGMEGFFITLTMLLFGEKANEKAKY